METFYTAYHTDIGIRKKTNQDSLLLKGITNGKEEVLLAVICDGMGGMEKGELASAYVVRLFSDWFWDVYATGAQGWTNEEIKKQWQELLVTANEKLIFYGKEHQIQLGTTATVLLLHSDGAFLIGHVGDTRVYRITDCMEQLTEDHSYVARELRRGNMTAAQAASDPRRNVLLQCIGVNTGFNPQFLTGQIEKGNYILLCSDGFRHMVTEHEMYTYLQKATGEKAMKQTLTDLVEWNKKRRETDNISAILIQLKE